jgi:hypothetical protein
MMRPFSEMTDERRCEAGAGLHYKSREWDEIFQDGGGWDGAWPEIDRHGRLTGRIVGDEAGYLNVNDQAMISEAEALAGGWGRPDDGYAEPPKPVIVEFAVADETIRDRGGIDEFAGLEHTHMAKACAAYRSAAIAALEDDPRAGRLVAESPRGQRILHSAWAGAHWSYSSGAIGAMADLTADEKAAVSAADDAGREAARKVIAEADAVEVEVCHASSIPGARWCRPVGWSPRNAIDGAEWSDGDGAWLDENGDAAGIVVYGDHAEGDRVTVALDDLRVASCGDCRVVGEVEVA